MQLPAANCLLTLCNSPLRCTSPLNFPPTFKLRRAAGFAYDHKRIPSYCDRIRESASSTCCKSPFLCLHA